MATTLGVLTGGGDCPGLNAVIRAVVRSSDAAGWDTAVTIATEAIDRLHTTAESHNRVMVVEVMGRHAGWIAVMSGIAGGADVILIPERPVDFDEVADSIRKRHARGKNFSIVVVR